MTHPYSNLPADSFWRSAVADRAPFAIADLWSPRFAISRDSRIITAGSCFAQHFSRALTARGYGWQDFEPGPRGLTPEQRRDFNYGVFSFRTGNIYTPRMLRQWLEWAHGDSTPPADVWEKDGRLYDPFRPAVEPGGFADIDELLASRAVTLGAIRNAVAQSDVLVFTLGLTESWHSRAGGHEYALCPGTVAGRFDESAHHFVNHDYPALLTDLTAALQLLARANPGLRVLLTVSPVPLAATASGQHVLLATSHSKALLRAVAGAAVAGNPAVDYFPSYEIISNPAYRGMFFEPDMRRVAAAGVDFVMHNFFRDQDAAFGPAARRRAQAVPPAKVAEENPAAAPAENDDAADELRCEEEILNAFART